MVPGLGGVLEALQLLIPHPREASVGNASIVQMRRLRHRGVK